MAYLGLDIGTTAVKAVLFDGTGRPLGTGLAEYTLETPAPDIVELDAEQYWISVKEALAQALKKAEISPASIRSLAITGQAETLVFVDNSGKPLRKAVVWLDNRAKAEAKEIEKRFGAQELFHMSGQTEMLPCWPAAKILWLRKNEPEIFRKTAQFLMVEDFIFHKLTGKFATCRGLLPSALYYDMRTGGYDRAMLDFLGLDPSRLPPLHEPGELMGECIENDSPLCPGTPVAGAPLDHICGSLGSGCVRPGIISETTGCTLALCAPSEKLIYDEERRISTYHGFTPGSFALLPWAPTAGMLLKHFRDEFCRGMSYAEFDRAAEAVPPGSEGLLLLPHCAGAVSPVCNPDARGVAYGITLAHKRGHWARAIMESIAFLLRDNVETLEALGVKIGELHSLGGASKSRLWVQIKADVLNRPFTLTDCEEATALGAAILGAVGAGDFPSAADAAEKMVRTSARIELGKDAERYCEYFHNYKNLNRLLMPTFGGKS